MPQTWFHWMNLVGLFCERMISQFQLCLGLQRFVDVINYALCYCYVNSCMTKSHSSCYTLICTCSVTHSSQPAKNKRKTATPQKRLENFESFSSWGLFDKKKNEAEKIKRKHCEAHLTFQDCAQTICQRLKGQHHRVVSSRIIRRSSHIT